MQEQHLRQALRRYVPPLLGEGAARRRKVHGGGARHRRRPQVRPRHRRQQGELPRLGLPPLQRLRPRGRPLVGGEEAQLHVRRLLLGQRGRPRRGGAQQVAQQELHPGQSPLGVRIRVRLRRLLLPPAGGAVLPVAVLVLGVLAAPEADGRGVLDALAPPRLVVVVRVGRGEGGAPLDAAGRRPPPLVLLHHPDRLLLQPIVGEGLFLEDKAPESVRLRWGEETALAPTQTLDLQTPDGLLLGTAPF